MPDGIREQLGAEQDKVKEKKSLKERQAEAKDALGKTLDTTAPKAINDIAKEVENITKNEAFTKLAPEEQEAVREGLKQAILNYVDNLKNELGEHLSEEAKQLEKDVHARLGKILEG